MTNRFLVTSDEVAALPTEDRKQVETAVQIGLVKKAMADKWLLADGFRNKEVLRSYSNQYLSNEEAIARNVQDLGGPNPPVERVSVNLFSAKPGAATEFFVPGDHHEIFFYALKGKGDFSIKYNGAEQRLSFKAGDFFYAPPAIPHKISNTGKEPLDVLYVSHMHSGLRDASVPLLTPIDPAKTLTHSIRKPS